MRGAILRRIKLLVLTIALCPVFTTQASGQTYDRFHGWCDTFRNATLPDLVQFLNAVVPDEGNGRCVSWAIHKLGNEHYEPAITALAKLLDFRRPATDREKLGFTDLGGIGGIWDVYPAAGALDLIGKKALPAVLEVIKAEASSGAVLDNAIPV